MKTKVFEKLDAGKKFEWLDVVNPSRSQLDEIAKEYSIHPTSIADCLDPEHLPKYEKIGDIHFLVLRGYDEKSSADADTVQELTRKIAVFYKPGLFLTIHRKDQEYLKDLRTRWVEKSAGLNVEQVLPVLLTDLLGASIDTFQKSLQQTILSVDELEAKIFEPQGTSKIFTKGYFLKRRASLFKRILRQTTDLLPKLNSFGELYQPTFQDLKENLDKVLFQADDLEENTGYLLSMHVSLQSHRTNEASQRTNEVMRLLTVISIFFLPLNFIAGIYGMNFEHMPELKWTFGYPFALVLMLSVSSGILLYFRKKGWLK